MIRPFLFKLIYPKKNKFSFFHSPTKKSTSNIKRKQIYQYSGFSKFTFRGLTTTVTKPKHWEEEELPGTSHDPETIAYNQQLKQFTETREYAKGGALWDEMAAKSKIDIQSYTIMTKLVKMEHDDDENSRKQKILKEIDDPKDLPLYMDDDALADFEPTLEMWNEWITILRETKDIEAMKNSIKEMRSLKVSFDKTSCQHVMHIYGESEGKKLLEEMLKTGELDKIVYEEFLKSPKEEETKDSQK